MEDGLARSRPIHDFGTAIADAAGVALVRFDAPFDEDWYVERIFFNSEGAAVPVVTVYVGSVADANAKDFSTGVDPNIADESSPIYVPGGSSLLVRATGATAASLFTVNLQYAPEGLETGTESGSGLLVASAIGVDGMLIEPGFPNQVRMPRQRR